MRVRHRDAAAYELGVLDEPEEFEAHLSGCPRCRRSLALFRPVTGALAEAARLGYLPSGPADLSPPVLGSPASGRFRDRDPAGDDGYPAPAAGTARRRKAGGCPGRWGPMTGVVLLLVLGAAVTAVARIRFAAAASIVSPGQLVAGTGADLRDLPQHAGIQ